MPLMYKYVYLLFVLLTMSCSDFSFVCLDNAALNNPIDPAMFHMISVDDECEYTVVSPCVDGSGKLKFDGSSFYINLKEPSGYIQLFDFKKSRDSVAIVNCDTELRGTTIQFELKKRYYLKNEKILLVKVKRNPHIAIFDSKSYHFFLSNKRGIIGSYFTLNGKSDVILQKRGDILFKEIDYSNIEFKGLE